MKVSAITLRAGTVIDYNGKLWAVTKQEIMQPGKGASVIQVEMRDVKTGVKDNVRFRTQETVERVRLEQEEYTFLYAEGDDNFAFMHKTNFEQISVNREVIGEKAQFLQEGMEVTIETYEGTPLGIEIPDTIVCTIVDCEPVVKGQTASSSYKPAKVDNGARVMVPPHIDNGTRIVIRTEDGSYVERFKE